MISTNPLAWYSATLTLCILSFLYKETRFYRFAEYTYIGVAVGHSFITSMNSLTSQSFTPISKGAIDVFLIQLFAILILTQPFRRVSWIARMPNSVMIGVGTGIAMYGALGSDIIALVQSTIKDGMMVAPYPMFLAYFSILGSISVLVYFFFTVRREALGGSVGRLAQIGRYFMMVAFGAVFANIILSRSTLFFSRMVFLLVDWLGLK